MSDKKQKNRLSKEKSPYLLQHQYNPVDWYPWGAAAFEKAKAEDKLIFLSIGYSTCHWCHVMERESFENDEIAALMNEHFISVKVDREERQDIDQIYMNAVQALTGSGGWPLTVFLTPDAKPVTGGTYFPPSDRYGRPGMKTLLPRISGLWKEKSEEMIVASQQLVDILQPQAVLQNDWEPSDLILHKAYEQLRGAFDSDQGGFGSEPKFPRSHDLSFLLRYAHRFKSPQALQMVTSTLDHMAAGGIYDHLGGGFARYSTDRYWLVPHFEKMLYDQAIIARTYLEAFQVTQSEVYRETVRGIFDYVMRDLRDSSGGFYSAEDADSEGEEGKFYVWKPSEIVQILGGERAKIFNSFYGVSESGNFEQQTSILHRSQSVADYAQSHAMDEGELHCLLEDAREELFREREKRIRPHRDDKVLTSWNGLMISALAFGGKVLEEPKWIEAAKKSAEFILNALVRDGRLLRRYRCGESVLMAFQDDYAFFVQALLDLYEATFDEKWLVEANKLSQQMVELFWDDDHGGFFYTAKDAEKLIARTKEYYDGAVPAGNSVAALNLLRLDRLMGREIFQEKIEQIFRSNAEFLASRPMNFTQMLIALDYLLGGSCEVALVGSRNDEEIEKMMGIFYAKFRPRTTLRYLSTQSKQNENSKYTSMIQEDAEASEKIAAYICKNFTCQRPVHDASEMAKLLDVIVS